MDRVRGTGREPVSRPMAPCLDPGVLQEAGGRPRQDVRELVFESREGRVIRPLVVSTKRSDARRSSVRGARCRPRSEGVEEGARDRGALSPA